MKKIFVFGGSGLVGSKFLETAKNIFTISAPNAGEVDILDQEKVKVSLEELSPEFVINFAAYTDVQKSEEQRGNIGGLVYKINATGAKNIAGVCNKLKIKLIHISTDYIFDGTKSGSPYAEDDKPNPVNWYGQTKYFGEKYVVESGCDFIIVRISMPFTSNYDLKKDIARFFLDQLRQKRKIQAITDEKITPVYTSDVANALIVLINSYVSGVYHVVSKNPTSPLEFATMIAKTFGLDISLIEPITLDEYNLDKKAKILRYSWLDCTKFEREFGRGILHTIAESVAIFKEAVDVRH